jgi:threonine/homoserine/homoserine lactone efflux protein
MRWFLFRERWPRPGVCVAWLGGYAVLFTVLSPDPTWAKALVAAGAFGLMWLEIRAINKDRDAHDAEMARLRAESEARFAAMMLGFDTSHTHAKEIRVEIAKIKTAMSQAATLSAGDPRLTTLIAQATSSASTIVGIVSLPLDGPFQVTGTPVAGSIKPVP